jgi:hypothetical protein
MQSLPSRNLLLARFLSFARFLVLFRLFRLLLWLFCSALLILLLMLFLLLSPFLFPVFPTLLHIVQIIWLAIQFIYFATLSLPALLYPTRTCDSLPLIPTVTLLAVPAVELNPVRH